MWRAERDWGSAFIRGQGGVHKKRWGGCDWCIFMLLGHGPGKVGRGTWQQGPALSHLCTGILGQSAHKLFVGILRQQEKMKLQKPSKVSKYEVSKVDPLIYIWNLRNK